MSPDVREVHAANRVDRIGDGGLLTDVRDDVEQAQPRCPWCEEPLDDKGECARRCRASRVNRTDNR